MSASASAGIHRSRPRRDQATERPTLTPERERRPAAYPAEFKDGAKLGFSGSAEDPGEHPNARVAILQQAAERPFPRTCVQQP